MDEIPGVFKHDQYKSLFLKFFGSKITAWLVCRVALEISYGNLINISITADKAGDSERTTV